jgi:hypothetical protein
MIQAFADDSVTPNVVACAVAVFQEERVAAAEELLCSEKVAVGIPAVERLHCRVMFSDHGRRGTPWEQLGPKGVYALVERVCERVRLLSKRPIVSVVDPRAMPLGPLTPGGPIRALDPKAIATMTYMGAWGGLLRRHQVGGFRLWIDPDSTRIQWGSGRRQADSTRGMYVDLGAGQEPPLLEPTFSEGPPPALLQLADVYAYIAVQAHGGRGGWRTRCSRDSTRLLTPRSRRWCPTGNRCSGMSGSPMGRIGRYPPKDPRDLRRERPRTEPANQHTPVWVFGSSAAQGIYYFESPEAGC